MSGWRSNKQLTLYKIEITQDIDFNNDNQDNSQQEHTRNLGSHSLAWWTPNTENNRGVFTRIKTHIFEKNESNKGCEDHHDGETQELVEDGS